MVKFNFPNKLIVEWKGGNSISRVSIISCLKACKRIYKGCLYHIVRDHDLDSEISPIESVPIENEFREVLPDDIPGIPSK